MLMVIPLAHKASQSRSAHLTGRNRSPDYTGDSFQWRVKSHRVWLSSPSPQKINPSKTNIITHQREANPQPNQRDLFLGTLVTSPPDLPLALGGEMA